MGEDSETKEASCSKVGCSGLGRAGQRQRDTAGAFCAGILRRGPTLPSSGHGGGRTPEGRGGNRSWLRLSSVFFFLVAAVLYEGERAEVVVVLMGSS